MFRDVLCWGLTTKSPSAVHSGVWGLNGSVPCLNETVPHRLMCLNTRSTAAGFVLGVNETSRRQSLSGVRMSLGVGDIERVPDFLIIHYSASCVCVQYNQSFFFLLSPFDHAILIMMDNILWEL